MSSARVEDALEHATDEELFSFFSEVPSVFRRRLIAVLSELESHEAQHYINTALPEEPDSDDLVWPSDPEGLQITSEPDSSSPESWGIFGKPVRPAPGIVWRFGGSPSAPSAASSSSACAPSAANSATGSRAAAASLPTCAKPRLQPV